MSASTLTTAASSARRFSRGPTGIRAAAGYPAPFAPGTQSLGAFIFKAMATISALDREQELTAQGEQASSVDREYKTLQIAKLRREASEPTYGYTTPGGERVEGLTGMQRATAERLDEPPEAVPDRMITVTPEHSKLLGVPAGDYPSTVLLEMGRASRAKGRDRTATEALSLARGEAQALTGYEKDLTNRQAEEVSAAVAGHRPVVATIQRQIEKVDKPGLKALGLDPRAIRRLPPASRMAYARTYAADSLGRFEARVKTEAQGRYGPQIERIRNARLGLVERFHIPGWNEEGAEDGPVLDPRTKAILDAIGP